MATTNLGPPSLGVIYNAAVDLLKPKAADNGLEWGYVGKKFIPLKHKGRKLSDKERAALLALPSSTSDMSAEQIEAVLNPPRAPAKAKAEVAKTLLAPAPVAPPVAPPAPEGPAPVAPPAAAVGQVPVSGIPSLTSPDQLLGVPPLTPQSAPRIDAPMPPSSIPSAGLEPPPADTTPVRLSLLNPSPAKIPAGYSATEDYLPVDQAELNSQIALINQTLPGFKNGVPEQLQQRLNRLVYAASMTPGQRREGNQQIKDWTERTQRYGAAKEKALFRANEMADPEVRELLDDVAQGRTRQPDGSYINNDGSRTVVDPNGARVVLDQAGRELGRTVTSGEHLLNGLDPEELRKRAEMANANVAAAWQQSKINDRRALLSPPGTSPGPDLSGLFQQYRSTL